MIDLESLPIWLLTIKAGKVRPECRDKLLKYKREAKQVLADRFFGRNDEPSDPIGKALYHNGQALKHCWEKIVEVAKRVDGVETKMALLALSNELNQQEVLQLPPGEEPWHTIREWAINNGIQISMNESGDLGRKLVKMLESQGVARRLVSVGVGKHNSYPESLLIQHLGGKPTRRPQPIPIAQPPKQEIVYVYRRSTQAERLDKLTAELVADAKRSDPWLASLADVSEGTTRKHRAVLEVRGVIEPATLRQGRDGKWRKSTQNKEYKAEPLQIPNRSNFPLGFSLNGSANGHHN